ncbi:MAG: hypothetical protein K0R55_3462, partial [Sporomusa sp.]|nr:hypothetical protein [Sporomusa sp.]
IKITPYALNVAGGGAIYVTPAVVTNQGKQNNGKVIYNTSRKTSIFRVYCIQ